MNNIEKEIIFPNINLYKNNLLEDDFLDKLKNNNEIKWKRSASPLGVSISQQIKSSRYKRSHLPSTKKQEDVEIKNLSRKAGYSCLPQIKDYLDQYNKNFSWVQQTFFIQYSKGDLIDHKTKNIDSSMSELCVILFLNDDYLGGEINFVNQDIKIKPEKNQMIIFPNNEKYPYDIEEIVSGTKYDYFAFLSKVGYGNPYHKK